MKRSRPDSDPIASSTPVISSDVARRDLRQELSPAADMPEELVPELMAGMASVAMERLATPQLASDDRRPRVAAFVARLDTKGGQGESFASLVASEGVHEGDMRGAQELAMLVIEEAIARVVRMENARGFPGDLPIARNETLRAISEELLPADIQIWLDMLTTSDEKPVDIFDLPRTTSGAMLSAMTAGERHVATTALARTNNQLHELLHTKRRRQRVTATFACRVFEAALGQRRVHAVRPALAEFRRARTWEYVAVEDDRVDVIGVWRMLIRQFQSNLSAGIRRELTTAVCLFLWNDSVAKFATRGFYPAYDYMERLKDSGGIRNGFNRTEPDMDYFDGGLSSDRNTLDPSVAVCAQVMGALLEGHAGVIDYNASNILGTLNPLRASTDNTKRNEFLVQLLCLPADACNAFITSNLLFYGKASYSTLMVCYVVFRGEPLTLHQLECVYLRMLDTLIEHSMPMIYETPHDFLKAHSNVSAKVASDYIVSYATVMHRDRIDIAFGEDRELRFGAYVCTIIPALASLKGGSWDAACQVLVDVAALLDSISVSDIISYVRKQGLAGESAGDWVGFSGRNAAGTVVFPPLHFLSIAMQHIAETYNTLSANAVPVLTQLWEIGRPDGSRQSIDEAVKTIASENTGLDILGAYKRMVNTWTTLNAAAEEYMSSASGAMDFRLSNGTTRKLIGLSDSPDVTKREPAYRDFFVRGICVPPISSLLLMWACTVLSSNYIVTGALADFIRSMDDRLVARASINLGEEFPEILSIWEALRRLSTASIDTGDRYHPYRT